MHGAPEVGVGMQVLQRWLGVGGSAENALGQAAENGSTVAFRCLT